MDYKTFNKGCLEEAKRLYKTANADQRYVLEKLFPELRETEDEKIRKNLINFLDAVWHLGKNANFDEHSKADCAEWISWLEKQEGCELIRKEWLEHIKQSWYKEGFIYGKYGGGTSKEWTINDTTTLNELIDFLENGTAKLQHDLTKYANWLKIQFTPIEKQGEQKVPVNDFKAKDWYVSKVDGKIRNIYHSVDKVEPKFHEGDWAVSNLDGKARQISEVHFDEYNSYYVVEGKSVNLEEYDRLHHLWTIQDAKDGDVLVTTFEEDNMIVMYRSMCTIDTINVHCCLDNKFTCANLGVFNAEDVKPATKEQRDLLFSEMKEAGYEWLKETHQLKKIAQKPYGQRKECSYCQFNYNGECKGFCAMKRSEQKHAWSEEDEDYINDLIKYFSQNEKLKNTKEDIVIWLKSIKRPYTNNKFT